MLMNWLSRHRAKKAILSSSLSGTTVRPKYTFSDIKMSEHSTLSASAYDLPQRLRVKYTPHGWVITFSYLVDELEQTTQSVGQSAWCAVGKKSNRLHQIMSSDPHASPLDLLVQWMEQTQKKTPSSYHYAALAQSLSQAQPHLKKLSKRASKL